MSAAFRHLTFRPQKSQKNSPENDPENDQKCVFKKSVFKDFWGAVLAFVFFRKMILLIFWRFCVLILAVKRPEIRRFLSDSDRRESW